MALQFRYVWIAILAIAALSVVTSGADEKNVRQYLDVLAARISKQPAPVSAKTWNAADASRRKKLMRMLGLDPLPKKSPLSPRYVGQPVDLEACTFQRVVFESSPGLFVAAHLYIPKGVTFPAPAVVYVPGHSRRDRYLPHTLAYGSSGYVAIGLPMVGEEGKIDSKSGNCGHYGPYYDQFHWYSTGYTPAGAEVWDTMRAIDFLLELKDSSDQRLVDPKRIGMAGLSGGSARTFWTTAADKRISAAVACQGFTTIHRYDKTIPSTCDVHLFYNYYLQPYGEVYGNAAPRALRVVQATEDSLYKNPQPVADWITKLYQALGKAENFSYVTFPGGHGYTPKVIAAEQEWLARWLKPQRPKLSEVTADQRKQFQANRGMLNDRKNLQCFTGSRADGWKLNGKAVVTAHVEGSFTAPIPMRTVKSMRAYEQLKQNLTKAFREEVLPHAFASRKVELQTGGSNQIDGLMEQQVTLVIDDTLTHPGRLIGTPVKTSKTIIMLADSGDKAAPQARALAKSGAKVLLLEVSQLKNKHVCRYAALVGHTATSLVVNDALAAFAALQQGQADQATGVYIQGKGSLAVAALYAAAVEPKIAGVILEDCPDAHDGETALMRVLRHSEIPISAGLVFPRPIVLLGKQAKGFGWTAALYKTLGRSDSFMKADASDKLLIDMLP